MMLDLMPEVFAAEIGVDNSSIGSNQSKSMRSRWGMRRRYGWVRFAHWIDDQDGFKRDGEKISNRGTNRADDK